jgi:hypothetical protein
MSENAEMPDVQAAVAARLASFPEFGGVSIILLNEGSVETRVDSALATMQSGRLAGIAILIATPVAEETGPNLPTVRLDPLGVTVQIIEDVIFNKPPTGSGRRALQWAVLVLRALKGWTPTDCQKPLTGWGAAIAGLPQEGQRVRINVNLKTRVDLPPLRLPGERGYA